MKVAVGVDDDSLAVIVSVRRVVTRPRCWRSRPCRQVFRGDGWRAVSRSDGAAVRLISADGVEHDHGDLALGLALVIGVGGPEFQRLFPQPRALVAGGGPGA